MLSILIVYIVIDDNTNTVDALLTETQATDTPKQP